MEGLTSPSQADEQDFVSVADVRKVPLEQLWKDADACRLVRMVMESTEGPAYVGVAMFSSGI